MTAPPVRPDDQPGPRPAPSTSRRGLLAGGTALVAAAAAGCDAFSTKPSGSGQRRERPGRRPRTGDMESPMLAKEVKAGRLPPVAKRLPDHPQVDEPLAEIGTYGGQWTTTMAGAADSVWLTRTIGYSSTLVAWDVAFTKPQPAVAESIDVADGGRTYTFHLRKGMKWSDGEPFGADDIVFWYDDVVNNKDLGGVVPVDLTAGGKAPTVKKVDDQTVVFGFPEPHGLFLDYLATTTGIPVTAFPKHYLRQFHAKYNPDIDQLVKKEKGVSNWSQLFYNKADLWGNPDLPVLGAWRVTTPLGAGNQVVAERNPYYFKTDSKGRQLPYLDRVLYHVIDDPEVILLKANNGELDMESWHINTVANKPVLARNRSGGGYEFFDMTWSWMNRVVVCLNLNHPDPGLRKLFQNKDFRIGLSYAINRPELIKGVFQQQGEPWQAAPLRDSEYYDEKLATQFTEYDEKAASSHLDRAGLDKRDADGFRLGPDGHRVAFSVEYPSNAGIDTFFPDAMELIAGYWKNAGIDVEMKAEDRSLWATRTAVNKFDATIWSGDGGGRDAILDPRYYFPFRSPGYSLYAHLWANWYMGVEPNEKPPPATLKQIQLYEKLKGTVDRDRQRELFGQVLQIAAEEFYCIGTASPKGDYGIKKVSMHNVPDPMILSWVYPTPGPTRPERYYTSA